MTEYGHVKVSRKVFRSPAQGGDLFWNEKRVFSRFEAWLDLIQMAAYADHDWKEGSVTIRILRGQTKPLALAYLAERWGWTKKRVRYFAEVLLDRGQIGAVGGARTGTVYLIVNYDAYQGGNDDRGTPEGTVGAREGHAEGTPGAQKISSKARKEFGGESKRGSSLPATWEPKQSHRELAERLGVFVDDEEVEHFRDHHAARGTVMKDWDRGFNTWIRTAKRFGRPANGNGKPKVTEPIVWDELTMGPLR